MDETLEQFARRLHCAHTNTDDIIEMLWEARRDSRTVARRPMWVVHPDIPTHRLTHSALRALVPIVVTAGALWLCCAWLGGGG